jgi:hypothetical protein
MTVPTTESPAPSTTAAAPRNGRLWVSIVLLVVSTVFLFARLGHYALWDDEALVAMLARSVWETGDTTAYYGHNIIGYRGGILLDEQFRDRLQPPLQFYLLAPVVGLFGDNAFALRLPFALCGLLTVALILWWLYRDRADLRFWLFMAAGLAGNVSFFLYFRQARYYGLVALLTLGIVYVYLHWKGTLRQAAVVSLMSALLLLCTYYNWAALYAALAVDYAAEGRRTIRLRPWHWLVIGVPQLATGLYVLITRFPALRTGLATHNPARGWADRAHYLWLLVRDMNACEFGSVLLVVVGGAWAYRRTRNRLLLRGIVFVFAYVLAIALVAARHSAVSEVRYAAPLIPLLVAISAFVLCKLADVSVPLAIAVAVLTFGTNLPHHLLPQTTDGQEPVPVRSSLASYVTELVDPPRDPYTLVSDWIGQNVRPGESIWVQPYFAVYPLMFHEPKAVYAWQFSEGTVPGNRPLDPVHLIGRSLPDYFVFFERPLEAREIVAGLIATGARYEPVRIIDFRGRDRYRPELNVHAFREPAQVDLQTQAIYIFRRAAPVPTTAPAPPASPASPTTSLANPSTPPSQSAPDGQTP